MSEQNIKSIDMDEVWFELRSLAAIVEMISVGMSEECALLQESDSAPNDSWRHICLANKTNALYSPALDNGCGQLHALVDRVGVSR